MDGGDGTQRALAYPAMRELLRQCVLETEADAAFVALLDDESSYKRPSLAIPATYPAEGSATMVTRSVKAGILQAIKATRARMMAVRMAASASGRAQASMLIVAPMYAADGSAWGAVAVICASSVIDADAISPVQQCARAITAVLTGHDDPYARSGLGIQPLAPRQRVQSGPREDFLLHELRVPLSAAVYALEALVQRHGPTWEYDDEYLLRTAQSGVEEAQRIVRSVDQWPALGLNVRKPQVRAIAVGEMVERALTLLPDARHRVVREIDADLPPVLGDESWITQVLVNLLENALKYSNAQSSIAVTGYQADRNSVVVRVQSWGNVVRFRRGYFAHASAHGAYSGLPGESTSKGLGLNIARYFVTSLGGELRIEDEGAEAFAVTVSLPIAPPKREMQWSNA